MSTPKQSPRIAIRSSVPVLIPLGGSICLKCTAEQINDVNILRYLHQRGKATIHDLLDTFAGTKQNMYGRLRRLMKTGYLQSTYSRSLVDSEKSFYYYSINPEALVTWNTPLENETGNSR